LGISNRNGDNSRPLLFRLEQAHRRALENHVHRHARGRIGHNQPDSVLHFLSWCGRGAGGLRRIGEQLVQELVVDRDALDQEPFRSEGGFIRLNKVFDGKLERLLADISEETWRRAG
jgi:hypothetical protein